MSYAPVIAFDGDAEDAIAALSGVASLLSSLSVSEGVPAKDTGDALMLLSDIVNAAICCIEKDMAGGPRRA